MWQYWDILELQKKFTILAQVPRLCIIDTGKPVVVWLKENNAKICPIGQEN